VPTVSAGLTSVDEIMVQDLATGSITPLTRMAGADGHSLEPSLGASGDFVALTSFASQLGGVSGAGSPNVFMEGPLDPSLEGRALLGVLDVAAGGAGPCTPTLTNQLVSKGASFAGDMAVVGSPVRVVQVGSGGGVSVSSFGREGVDVALSAGWVCAIAKTNALGNPGRFAACGSRGGSALSDLTVQGAPLAAEKIGLCGQRAIALGSNGVLYQANLASSFAARPSRSQRISRWAKGWIPTETRASTAVWWPSGPGSRTSAEPPRRSAIATSTARISRCSCSGPMAPSPTAGPRRPTAPARPASSSTIRWVARR
jgi:hypothetical protein